MTTERRPEPIASIAAVLRLPVGTRMYLVRNMLGSCAPTARVVEVVQSRAIGLRVDDPSSKNNGAVSYLSFSKGDVVEALHEGFRVRRGGKTGDIAAEYRFTVEVPEGAT